MSGFLRKTFKATVFAYALSLPAAFLVGGAYYSRPIRTPVPVRALKERLDPTWNQNFLRGTREIHIPIGAKVRLAASVFGADANTCVIILHRSGGNRLDNLALAYRLWQANIGVVLLDRRAHGSSEGETQPLFLDESKDLVSAIDWLIEERAVGTQSIGVIGVGDAATTALLVSADDPRVDAVVAIEPVANATDYISRNIARWTGLPRAVVWPQAFLTVRAMVLFAGVDSSLLDARARLALVNAPVLVVTGDDPLARRDGHGVMNALRGTKVELLEAPADSDGYDRLVSFLDRNS